MTDEQTNGQTDERTDICECRVALRLKKSEGTRKKKWGPECFMF